MATTLPRYDKEESARRGEEIFERDIRPRLEAVPKNHFVLIDVESGAYEVDADEMAALHRLRTRLPNAHVWIRRVGSRHSYRFGPRMRRSSP